MTPDDYFQKVHDAQQYNRKQRVIHLLTHFLLHCGFWSFVICVAYVLSTKSDQLPHMTIAILSTISALSVIIGLSLEYYTYKHFEKEFDEKTSERNAILVGPKGF